MMALALSVLVLLHVVHATLAQHSADQGPEEWCNEEENEKSEVLVQRRATMTPKVHAVLDTQHAEASTAEAADKQTNYVQEARKGEDKHKKQVAKEKTKTQSYAKATDHDHAVLNGSTTTCPVGFNYINGEVPGCGLVGNCDNYATSLDDCASQCQSHGNCNSFSWFVPGYTGTDNPTPNCATPPCRCWLYAETSATVDLDTDILAKWGSQFCAKATVTVETFSDASCTTPAAAHAGVHKKIYRKVQGSACFQVEYFKLGEPGSGTKGFKLDGKGNVEMYVATDCTGTYTDKFPVAYLGLELLRCPSGCVASFGETYAKWSGTGFDPDTDETPTCAPATTCHIETNFNYPGDDLRSMTNIASATICANLCAVEPACRSFAYGKKPGQWYTKTCFLKRSVKPGRKADDCCDSGLPCQAAAPLAG